MKSFYPNKPNQYMRRVARIEKIIARLKTEKNKEKRAELLKEGKELAVLIDNTPTFQKLI